MKSIEELRIQPHLIVGSYDARMGMWSGDVEWDDFKGSVIWGYDEPDTNGNGWEHVSISNFNPRKLPSWDVMCRLKDMFFYKTESAVQLHPAEEHYFHGFQRLPNVLHLWRPKDGNWEHLNVGGM